ncbi:ABC transporter substrate-binding protein [Staphylococcus felis]|uniref:ABC transporter substrate-binding protein n=1 Tax=Staphylococcus felis TaxID=46127 RepID=UPI003F4329A1
MKKRLILTVTTSVAILLGACSNHQDENQVKVSLPTEAKANQLDAQSYDAAMPVYSAVYEPLVSYDKKNGVKPGLAEKWSVDDSGREYTFYLKRDVKFSDGSSLNAQAVKFSIDRAKAINKESTVETLKQLDEVVVEDDYTVQIKLKVPSNQVLNELTQVRPLRIMSPNAVEGGKPDGKFKKAIGTGAFVVGESGKEQTTMTPNKYYNHEHPVKYDLAFQTIEDSDSRDSAVQSGAIDITGGSLGMLTDQQIKGHHDSKDLKVVENPSTVSHFMAFNPEKVVFKDENIREALSKSINTDALDQKKMQNIFQKDVQFVNKDNQQDHVYDIKAAGKLLEQQGYAKNKNGIYEKDGKPLSFNLVIQTAEYPGWKDKAEQVQENLKEAGIQINIKTLDTQSYYDTLWTKKDFDLIFYRTYSDALMPYNFLNSVFKNTENGPGVLADDETLSNQLDAFPKIVDSKAQQQAFDDIFNHFNTSYYSVPIAYPNETFVTSDKIENFQFSGLTDAPIRYDQLKVKQ